MDRRLCTVDRLAQLGHRLACGPCRKAATRMKLIEEAARSIQPSDPVPLPDEARERIATEIQAALGQVKTSPPNQEDRQK